MRQREPRRKVLVRARMRDGAEWCDVLIHNMSSRGLLAAADVACSRGTIVEIRRVHHVIIGRVVWEKDGYFGLRTQDRIDIDAIVQAKPPAFKPGTSPQAAAGGDRRGAGRAITAATIAAREARSRRVSAAVQFAALIGAAALGSLLIADRVRDVLARPMATIGAHLDGTATASGDPAH